MSKSLIYRCVSFLAALAVLFSIMPVSIGNLVQAASPAHDLSVPMLQASSFTVRGSVRNRDGAPLSGVAIVLHAYKGDYRVGQSPTVTRTMTTAADGMYAVTFSSPVLTDTTTIRIQHTSPAGYVLDRIDPSPPPPDGSLDGQVIQFKNVRPSAAALDVGAFVDKRQDAFEFLGTMADGLDGSSLGNANARMTYATATGVTGSLDFLSDARGNWAFREAEHPGLNLGLYDVVTFTFESRRTVYPGHETSDIVYDLPGARVASPAGIVENNCCDLC